VQVRCRDTNEFTMFFAAAANGHAHRHQVGHRANGGWNCARHLVTVQHAEQERAGAEHSRRSGSSSDVDRSVRMLHGKKHAAAAAAGTHSCRMPLARPMCGWMVPERRLADSQLHAHAHCATHRHKTREHNGSALARARAATPSPHRRRSVPCGSAALRSCTQRKPCSACCAACMCGTAPRVTHSVESFVKRVNDSGSVPESLFAYMMLRPWPCQRTHTHSKRKCKCECES
jgi:hypothetical protein